MYNEDNLSHGHLDGVELKEWSTRLIDAECKVSAGFAQKYVDVMAIPSLTTRVNQFRTAQALYLHRLHCLHIEACGKEKASSSWLDHIYNLEIQRRELSHLLKRFLYRFLPPLNACVVRDTGVCFFSGLLK